MTGPVLREELRRVLRPEEEVGEMPGAEPCSLALYRQAAGESTAEEERAFQAHLASCAGCREDLAALADQHPDAWRVRPARRARVLALRWVAAAAIVLLAAGVVLWRLRPPPEGPGAPELRVKGGHRLQVAVQRGGERFVARSGAHLLSGDVLGFFYTAPAEAWVAVLFVDEGGRVTRLFPAGEEALARLPAGAQRPLPDGAVLEEGKGCEWIVGFFAQRAGPVAPLADALRAAVARRGSACSLPPLALEATAVDVVVLRRSNTNRVGGPSQAK